MRTAFLCSKLSSPTLGVCSIELANSVFPNILGLNNYKFSLQMLHVSFLPRDKKNCPIPKEKNALIYENYNCATVKYSESGTMQHGGCCPLPASISDTRCSIQSLKVRSHQRTQTGFGLRLAWGRTLGCVHTRLAWLWTSREYAM